MKRLITIGAAALASLGGTAQADRAGFAEAVDDGDLTFAGADEAGSVEVSGYFRARGEALYNLDLDRGLTPSGKPLFPIPLADPSAQTFSGANMRLRTDVRLRGPGTGVSAVVRVDVVDNLSLGSTPNLRDGSTGASISQDAPLEAMLVKRAYGEAVLPIGVLTVGRQGSHWGLGMVANGGDCEDCDSGDAADRIAFVTPLFQHIFAVAYDISATGPQRADRSDSRAIDIEPTDDVQNFTFAFMRYHSPMARARRARAGWNTVEYGMYVSHRTQDNDLPASYLIAGPSDFGSASVMHRGLSATASDLWIRLTGAGYRVELEAAFLHANVEQSSLVPNAEFYEAATSQQLGLAIESEVAISPFVVGVNAGFASGDPSPGFGAFPNPQEGPAQAGELDGLQADLPFDTRIDNFRFHSDYRIDRILFREIIGTVTDAIYLRPHLRVPLADAGGARLIFETAVIASWAVQAESTPSGARALGIEIDPGLRYESRTGLVASLEYALLLPLAGFDNPLVGLDARPAQLGRLQLLFPF